MTYEEFCTMFERQMYDKVNICAFFLICFYKIGDKNIKYLILPTIDHNEIGLLVNS